MNVFQKCRLAYFGLYEYHLLKIGVLRNEKFVPNVFLPMSIIVDKIYYENQNRIRKVVMDILREELDKIVLKKNDLKLQFKNIKVVGCGK